MSFQLPPEQTVAAAWYGPELARCTDWQVMLTPSEFAEVEAATKVLASAGCAPSKSSASPDRSVIRSGSSTRSRDGPGRAWRHHQAHAPHTPSAASSATPPTISWPVKP